ncbi:MAG: VWA domain-containing protein [Planctomycetota bacterium]|nr:MAG: VWA domain-containing protein [Planctomycetota bacterium]
MRDVVFDDLRWLHLLWAVLLVVGLRAYALWRSRRALREFADADVIEKLVPPLGWARPLAKLTMQTGCLVALVAALIHPRWGEAEEKFTTRGIDVMVLIDVSRSMLARDIAPNRLERAKLAVRDDLLPALGGDRVGLITFAGVATLKCPLTHDYGYFRLVLDDVSTESSPRGGTLIGDAIRLAEKSFDEASDTQKLIVLITDGEDHDSYPVEAARNAWKDNRIAVIAVALGDERDGARIPISSGRGEDYLKYHDQVVWSKANFDDLRAIAAASGLNAFVGAGTRNFDLGEIYKRVAAALEHKSRIESQRVERPSRFHPFAVAALVLLLIDSFVREGPRRTGTVVALPSASREAA